MIIPLSLFPLEEFLYVRKHDFTCYIKHSTFHLFSSGVRHQFCDIFI